MSAYTLYRDFITHNDKIVISSTFTIYKGSVYYYFEEDGFSDNSLFEDLKLRMIVELGYTLRTIHDLKWYLF